MYLPSSPLHLLLALLSLLSFLPISTHATTTPATKSDTLTLTAPANLPPLRYSTRAYLRTNGTTLTTRVTRRNTFTFPYHDLLAPEWPTRPYTPVTADGGGGEQVPGGVRWELDIWARDWGFVGYGIDVTRGTGKGEKEGEEDVRIEVFRLGAGKRRVGEGMRVLRGQPVELRVKGPKEYYEERQGFNPLQLLKSPMVLIGVVGLAFVMGMPYLLDNMDPETRAEFEEQQKKGIFGGAFSGGGGGGGGGSGNGEDAPPANPLKDFDMASWMAGRSSTPTLTQSGGGSGEGKGSGRDSGGGGIRRRG